MTRMEIAQAIVEEMRAIHTRFWDEWGTRYAALPEFRKEELQREVNAQIEEARLRIMGVVDGPSGGDPGDGGSVLGAYPGPMSPVGQDFDGGDDLRYAKGKHSHPIPPQTDPITVISTLYPAKIVDPLNRGQVACVFLGPHYGGGNTPMLAGWVEIAPGILEYPTEGPIPATWLDGVSVESYGSSGYSTMVGKTVLAYHPGTPSLTGVEEPLQLLYIIEDTGTHWEPYLDTRTLVSTKPRLRRVPAYSLSSQWVHGMTFQVQSGTVYGTDFFTLDNTGITIGTTPIEWVHTEGPTFSWADRYELLTGPQLLSEKATTTTETFAWSMASGDAGAPQGFETLVGTPGVSPIPAGPWLFDLEAIWIDAVPSGTTTTLRFQILKDNGITSPVLFTAESPPITNTMAAPLSFAFAGAEYACETTDRLVALCWLHTDSVTPVTLHLRYTSATRGTKITAPFAMPNTGSTIVAHPALDGRFPDVGAGNPPAHNWDGIGPTGRAHTTFGTATLSGAGTARKLSMPTASSRAEITLGTSEVIYGIDPAGFLHGDSIKLLVRATPTNTGTFVHLGGTAGTGADLDIYAVAGGGKNYTLDAATIWNLTLDTTSGCWRLE
jgi:hypothetical protein